jgi:hypothetical protein
MKQAKLDFSIEEENWSRRDHGQGLTRLEDFGSWRKIQAPWIFRNRGVIKQNYCGTHCRRLYALETTF